MAFSKTSPGVCKECYNARKKKWRLDNPEKQKRSEDGWRQRNPDKHMKRVSSWIERNKDRHRRVNADAHFRREYGISIEDYEASYAAQNGRCRICKEQNEVLCVDHDHASGQVRDLLCRRCNSVLGFVNENPQVLSEMIAYIGRWQGFDSRTDTRHEAQPIDRALTSNGCNPERVHADVRLSVPQL